MNEDNKDNSTQQAVPMQSTGQLVQVGGNSNGFQPMTVAQRSDIVSDLRNKVILVQEVMKNVMQAGVHYGAIPGCGDKPVLLQAGAEMLCMVFRLTPKFSIQERDIAGPVPGHKQFNVVCTLSDGTQGVGSCSTMEGKYRFKGGQRVKTDRPVPKTYWDYKRKGDIEKAQGIIGGKGFSPGKDDDGNWFIFEKGTEKAENQNPADCWNTCLKIAKKRSQVDASKTATGSSSMFTQDLEDFPEEFGYIQKPISVKEAPKMPQERSEPAGGGIVPQESMQGRGEALVDSGRDLNPEPEGSFEEAFQAAEPAQEAPATPVDNVNAWKMVEIHFGTKKGTSLGNLPKNTLFGWFQNWFPKPDSEGRLKAQDKILRDALDQAAIKYKWVLTTRPTDTGAKSTQSE